MRDMGYSTGQKAYKNIRITEINQIIASAALAEII
jgi:hypothetical protein